MREPVKHAWLSLCRRANVNGRYGCRHISSKTAQFTVPLHFFSLIVVSSTHASDKSRADVPPFAV